MIRLSSTNLFVTRLFGLEFDQISDIQCVQQIGHIWDQVIFCQVKVSIKVIYEEGHAKLFIPWHVR